MNHDEHFNSERIITASALKRRSGEEWYDRFGRHRKFTPCALCTDVKLKSCFRSHHGWVCTKHKSQVKA